MNTKQKEAITKERETEKGEGSFKKKNIRNGTYKASCCGWYRHIRQSSTSYILASDGQLKLTITIINTDDVQATLQSLWTF
jgi:hypothetical protein